MRALLDVNILIALLDADHVHHRTARDWLTREGRAGWASCPITQNGCIRILSHARYPNAQPVSVVVGRLAEATAHPMHTFWPDDSSLLDGRHIDPSRIHGTGRVTDVYLLALATARGGKLVTFDRSVVLDAVVGASARTLERL